MKVKLSPPNNAKPAGNFRYLLNFQVACAVALIVLCIYYYRNSIAFQQSRSWVKHSNNIIENTLIISAFSKRMQLENRNYNLAGTAENLHYYIRIRDSIGYYVRNLIALTKDNYVQQNRALRLQSELSEVRKLADRVVRRRAEKGFNDVEFRQAVIEQSSFFNDIDTLLSSILKEENRLLISREADDREKLAYTNYTFLGIVSLLCLALIGAAIGLIYFYRRSNKREREIEKSEARFRLLVDSLRDVGLYAVNDRGYIVNWYEGAHNLKGYKREEVIGKHFSMFYTKEDDENGEPAKVIDMALRFGSYESEGWRLRNDGSKFWADVLVTSVYEEGQKLVGFIIVTRNFDEHKRIEEERGLALEKEKELNQMKSNFVSLASHEFRSPLSAILSSVSLMEQYRSAETQDKRDKHLQRIKISIRDMVATLEEFLSLEKIEEGKVNPIKTVFNLREFISKICENLSAATKSGQAVSCCHKGPEEVLTDSMFFSHIVTNLVSNAIKYSPLNTGVLVSSETVKNNIILKVKDEGIGIPEEDQRHLFERFFRASNTGNIKGTGLGLHITKRYTELLGGTVEVRSELNKGTEFTVVLPSSL